MRSTESRSPRPAPISAASATGSRLPLHEEATQLPTHGAQNLHGMGPAGDRQGRLPLTDPRWRQDHIVARCERYKVLGTPRTPGIGCVALTTPHHDERKDQGRFGMSRLDRGSEAVMSRRAERNARLRGHPPDGFQRHLKSGGTSGASRVSTDTLRSSGELRWWMITAASCSHRDPGLEDGSHSA